MSPLARALAAAVALVVGMTALGVALGVLVPGFAGNVGPHRALTGTFGTAAGIFASNVRLLAVPFALCLLGFPLSHFGRRAGTLLILAIVAINTLTVGIELGHWRGQLIPYVPQLPLEWAALTTAVGAWLSVRNGHGARRQLAHLAAATVVLLVCAAMVETWGTPHKRAGISAGQTQADAVGEPVVLVGDGGCLRHGFCADLGRGRFKVAGSLPLTTFGSARPSGRR